MNYLATFLNFSTGIIVPIYLNMMSPERRNMVLFITINALAALFDFGLVLPLAETLVTYLVV